MKQETRAKLLEIAEQFEAEAREAQDVLDSGYVKTIETRTAFLQEKRTAAKHALLLRQHAGGQQDASSQSEGAPSPADPPAPTCPECETVDGVIGKRCDLYGIHVKRCRHPWHDREES